MIIKSANAKYVGSTLVASFPKANPPLVWAFDLERNHSYTLAMQEQNGGWDLGITSFKGTLDVIAHFDTREDIQDAFYQVQRVLMKGRRSLFGRILFWGAVIIVVPTLLFVSVSTYERWSLMMRLRPPAPPVKAPVEMENGIPLSADDVLKPPTP